MKYPAATKAHALLVYKEMGSGRRTAEHLGIHYQTIFRWAREDAAAGKPVRWRCCEWLQDATQNCQRCGAMAPVMIQEGPRTSANLAVTTS